MNGQRHPRVPTLIECNSWIRGGGTRSSKNRFGSLQSRVDANVVTYDSDVGQVDIDEENHINNSDNAIIDSDDDDDAGIFSIVHDCSSEEDDNLAEEEKKSLSSAHEAH